MAYRLSEVLVNVNLYCLFGESLANSGAQRASHLKKTEENVDTGAGECVCVCVCCGRRSCCHFCECAIAADLHKGHSDLGSFRS